MNYKSIFFFLAVYSILISFFSILNILYSIYFSFVLDLNSYLITLGVSLTFGISLYYLGHNYNKNITLIDQVTFIILGFIILPVFLSIPYYLSIYDISFIDSYFEAISGFTTTGFSIIETPLFAEKGLAPVFRPALPFDHEVQERKPLLLFDDG